MLVKLTHDTVVRFAKDSVVEVSPAEASRLIAFNNAVEVESKAEAKATKKTKKK